MFAKLSTFSSSLVTGASVIVLALAAGALIACGQPSPEKLIASAKEHLAKGDRNAAVIQLKNVLQQVPDNGEARLLLGEALFDAGDYVSAEKELARALELKQPQEKVVPAYIRALLAQGKNQAVVTQGEKYRLFNPLAVAATETALGDAQMQLGNRSGAQKAYSAALAAVPGYPRARLGEAALTALDGRIDDALRQVDEVIAVEPKFAEAMAFRAKLLLAKGDRDGAKKLLQDAIAVNERLLPARLALIGVLIDEREFDAAAKLTENGRKLAPSDLRLIYLDAALAFQMGNTEKARQQIQSILKLVPDNLPALVLAGAIDLQEKQLSAAETHLRKALAKAPNHVGARRLLLKVYLRSGQPLKAKDTLLPLLDRGLPDEPQWQLLAGETFLANGDAERANVFYQAAAKGQSAQQAAARTRLGQVALATGKIEDAFAQLEAASALDADATQADLALIAGRLQRKELGKAMDAVQALEKKQPKNPLTFQMYGLVHFAKGDMDAARTNLERALELDPKYLPSAYSLALVDIRQGRPGDAIKRYEAMSRRDPRNEQVLIALAEHQARTGSAPKDVIATLQRAVQANPEAPAARLALINYELHIGDTRAALTAAKEALVASPSDARVLETAGMVQEAAGESNQAIETYNKLAVLQPQSPKPLYRLAALYLRQQETDKAIQSLRRVQQIAPREVDVIPQLAQVFIADKRYNDALKEAREWQKREPTSAGSWSLEGDVQFAQRNFVQAERLYRAALKLDPKANAVAVKLHTSLVAAGKSNEADTWAKKWIAENPNDAAMHIYLGERERGVKNLKASAAHYRAAIGIEPRNALALNNLAWIGGQLGDPKALEYSERAVKLAPNNPDFLDTYGMLLVNKGEAEKGLPYLERAQQIAPARHDLRLHYAEALIGLGRKDDARKELQTLQGAKESFPGKDRLPGLLKAL